MEFLVNGLNLFGGLSWLNNFKVCHVYLISGKGTRFDTVSSATRIEFNNILADSSRWNSVHIQPVP